MELHDYPLGERVVISLGDSPVRSPGGIPQGTRGGGLPILSLPSFGRIMCAYTTVDDGPLPHHGCLGGRTRVNA